MVMLILKLECKHFAMLMGSVNVVSDFEVMAVAVSEPTFHTAVPQCTAIYGEYYDTSLRSRKYDD